MDANGLVSLIILFFAISMTVTAVCMNNLLERIKNLEYRMSVEEDEIRKLRKELFISE